MLRFNTQQRTTTLTLPALIFIYIAIGLLIFFITSNLFTQFISSQSFSVSIYVVVFLIISFVLLLFLAVALFRLVRDVITKKSGSRLKLKLFSYFFLLTILISIPTIIIHTRLISNLLFTWNQASITDITEDARWFALDAYRYRLALLKHIADSDLAEKTLLQNGSPSDLDPAVLSIQQFSRDTEGLWHPQKGIGNQDFFLPTPPNVDRGFVNRNPDRDNNCIRYIAPQQEGNILLITFSLGANFDEKLARIEDGRTVIGTLSNLEKRIVPLLGGFYLVFFLPILLMVVIIAISLSASLSQPISNLVQAIQQVASGDLSIRIISRTNDDLGSLIDSFNSMVRNLEKAQSKALQTEKENIWKDMSQRLAHEIKNPLTPIKLSAERVLRRWKNEPDRLGEILETSMMAIIQETDSLTNLLSEFRTFSRLPPPILERTALKPLVEDTIGLYKNSFPAVEFVIDGINQDLYLRADRRHISQVLTNLIINSIDAMHNSGRIEIRTDLVKKQDCRYCRVSIRDTGSGIPAENRPLIFTPYFTTKAAGTGLGLSIVERIVLDHGGSIWFDSAVGVGTTFYIDLPVDEGPKNQ